MGGFLILVGVICFIIGAIIRPKEDGRYSSGYKDNKTSESSDAFYKWGGYLLIIGILIAWIFG